MQTMMQRHPSAYRVLHLRRLVTIGLLPVLFACGGGGGGNPASVEASISGRITYDRVPHGGPGSGLDYAATETLPARGVTVEIVAAGGGLLGQTRTSDTGRYAFSVRPNIDVLVRVKAEMVQQDILPAWDVRVVDNTQAGALYTMRTDAFNTGTVDNVVDINAGSGWDPATRQYQDTRVAAPFAILDTVRDSILRVLDGAADVSLPPLTLNWSPLNRSSAVFDPASGQIVTTAYVFDPDFREIFVLGDADVDTDEYDPHVIAHEWGHYLEDQLARTDSPGGAHDITRILDPRLAFSEGWSNAFSAMALNDSLYSDSLGFAQATSFFFDVEDNTTVNAGWYNESSVHSVLYDIFDETQDGNDAISLGFAPLYEALTTWHARTDAVTSIFSFIPELKNRFPADAPGIDVLLADQQIVGDGMDIFATTETNDAGSADVLPVFTDLQTNGAAATVCSITSFGSFNGLSVRRFLRFEVDGSGTYRIAAAGDAGSDPDFAVYRRGFLALFQSEDPGLETADISLGPGTHVLEVYEFGNVSVPTRGRTCFDVSVQRL
jgi:hypothetical protein